MSTTDTQLDPFAGLVQAWLVWLEHNRGVSVATSDKYRRYLHMLGEFATATGTDAARLSTEQIERFTGLWLYQRGMGPSARKPVVAALRGFFAWLQRGHHRPDDPARAVPYPNAGRALPVPMSLATAERLMMAPDMTTFIGVRDAAILGLLIGCGLRVSGAVNLDEEDLLFAEEKGRQRLIVRVTEKGAKQRLVPTPHEARLLVLAYLGHPALAGYSRLLRSGRHVLFVNAQNRAVTEADYFGEAVRLSARSIGRMIVRYGEPLGLPRDQLRPHAARHLVGTEMAEDDQSPLIVQALLGHETLRTTEIYTHLARRKLIQAIDRSSPLSKIRSPVKGLAGKI